MDLTLHPKQGLAFRSQATEILYGGAAGGGKSHLLRVAALAWCTAIPGLQVYFFRRTHPELAKNHLEGAGSFPALLAAWIAARCVRINASQNVIRFSNGSNIHLCHCQYPRDLLHYQGAEIHVLMIDELTQWPWDMYSFLRGRLRLGGLALPERYRGLFPRILTGANPGGIGHNAVKAAFVDPMPPLTIQQMPREEGGMRRQFIPARLEDNPTLTESDPDYEARLVALGTVELVRALRYGDWDIVAGGMFDDLWRPEAHVVAPFEVPRSWRVNRSFDWGSSKPFSVGWWAESDGSDITRADGTKRSTVPGDLFRIGEWYGWNGKPNEGCRMLAREIAAGIRDREKTMRLIVRPGPADSAIFDVENGHSIGEEMAAVGIDWLRADKSPGSRKQGWQRLRSLLEGANSKEAPGLFVFETCRHFIRTLPVLPRDSRDPDDVNSSAEDHIADECRYRVYAKRQEMSRRKLAGL